MIIETGRKTGSHKIISICDNCLDRTPPTEEGGKLPDGWMHFVISLLEEDPTDETVDPYYGNVVYCSKACEQEHMKKLLLAFEVLELAQRHTLTGLGEEA